MVKQKKLKIAVLVFFKQENCYNKMTSVRKSYIFKSAKNKKLLPHEKLETSWLLTDNLKEAYYHLYQQTVY